VTAVNYSFLSVGCEVAKGILVVESNPTSPEREAEYNDWYTNTHLGEVCSIPGIVAARRYKVHGDGGPLADPSRRQYVAIYELDSDDLGQPFDELGKRAADGALHMSDALQLSPPPVVTVYELVE
jgi:hypothetical protein